MCARIAIATEGSTMTALMWTTRVRDGGQAAPVSADEFKAAAAGLKGYGRPRGKGAHGVRAPTG